MSAVQAEQPLRRRALERQGLTPEVELQLLIQEQQADDVYFVGKQPKVVSLDSPAPKGDGVVSDFVGVIEGQIVSFLPRGEESLFLISVNHASFDAYNNKGCRCRQCKTFMAEYRRQKRAAA